MKSRFSSRLKAIREKRDLTQSQLGIKAGIHQTAINHFENGRRLPSFESIIALAQALRVSTDTLLLDGNFKGTAFSGEEFLDVSERGYIQAIIHTIIKMKG